MDGKVTIQGMVYDVVIIGGGPAGAAAAVYAARKRLQTLLITESFGGQSIVSDEIENWVGEPRITGLELAQKLEGHVRQYGDVVTVREGRAVAVGRGEHGGFVVDVDGGGREEGRAVILATGGRRRKLGVPGEDKLEGKGVAYCSTCDAPIFRGKEIAVVGGGNAGLEAVEDLLPYAKHVYLLETTDALRGDPVTRERVEKNGNVTVILNARTKEIRGERTVTELMYEAGGEEKELAVQGVFVEIGSVPNSEPVKSLVAVNARGEVEIDLKTAATSVPGVFAAGDVTDDPYKQNNISAGDAVKAALSAHEYLKRN